MADSRNTMTDEQIMTIADEWFKTGENQHFREGYRYRSLGTPVNVWGADLIAFARAVLAAAVPPGFVLVPATPTQAMLDAMQSSGWMPANYRAMIAAATQEQPHD